MTDNKYYTYVYLDPRKPGKYCYETVSFTLEPIYVGKGCGKRHVHHIKHSDKYPHNPYLQNKLNKIYALNLQPIIIKLIDSISEREALNLEKQLIKEIGRRDLAKGFLTNFTDGGEGLRNPSQETRQKIRNANLGKKLSMEARRKISERVSGERNSMFGRTHSENTRRRLSEANRGKKLSEETKEKIRKAEVGRQSPFKGKHHSKEARMKVSEANRGKRLSEETRNKMARAHLGRKCSEQVKLRISEKLSGRKSPLLGKHLSEETRNKIARARLGTKASEETKRKMVETRRRLAEENRKRKEKASE